jgi:DmsE family decaheme c-type cytochrome
VITLTAPLYASAEDNSYVGDATCLTCHEALNPGFTKHYQDTIHSRVLTPGNARTSLMERGCESCHGPGGIHVQSGGGKGVGGMEAFEGGSGEAIARESAVCLQCHEGGEQRFWHASAHDNAEVGCTSCHTLMKAESRSSQLAKPSQVETCGSCHQLEASRISRNSHMPVDRHASGTAPSDNKMSCSTCHNPHGTVTENLLAANSVNDGCLSCHADKRGPFAWEHAPVTENCMNCHDPHGSTREKMLNMTLPRLCQQCHIETRHPTNAYDPSHSRVIGKSCLNCHTNIHGSNHPSGVRFLR